MADRLGHGVRARRGGLESRGRGRRGRGLDRCEGGAGRGLDRCGGGASWGRRGGLLLSGCGALAEQPDRAVTDGGARGGRLRRYDAGVRVVQPGGLLGSQPNRSMPDRRAGSSRRTHLGGAA
jgi:hypothetical protein